MYTESISISTCIVYILVFVSVVSEQIELADLNTLVYDDGFGVLLGQPLVAYDVIGVGVCGGKRRRGA